MAITTMITYYYNLIIWKCVHNDDITLYHNMHVDTDHLITECGVLPTNESGRTSVILR